MGVKRKCHNLDERLLQRAARALGAATETEAIHKAQTSGSQRSIACARRANGWSVNRLNE